MNQKFDILQVLSEGVSFTKDLKENIRQIFREQGEGICLSTIHKSKGLENDNVFILCPELIPNRFAVQEWQLKQEDNLLYVAITRAKKKLIFLSDYEEVIENLESNDPEALKLKGKVYDLQKNWAPVIKKLANLGAKFGYDGHGPGYCGVSFVRLLVIDPKTNIVYPIYLSESGPC